MSAVSDVVSRVPPPFLVRLAWWLVGLERDKLDADLLITLRIRRGRVARWNIQPPPESGGWRIVEGSQAVALDGGEILKGT